MVSFNNAAQFYKGMSNYGNASDADSHKLITMLYDGVLESLSSAKGAMQRKDIPVKGNQISRAITIIDGLRAHLNLEKGGEIARNLRDLYVYMENRLFEANLKNAEAMLDEVSSLIKNIRSGWEGIKPAA